MLLKLSAKEAYGVNMAMTLCQGSDCSVQSSKAGNTEVLYAVVRGRKSYTITLDYSHSIVEISSFYDCPHARISLSMTGVDEARNMLKQPSDRPGDYVEKQEKFSYESLDAAFNLMSESAGMSGAAFVMSGPDALYTFDVQNGAYGSE
jgi:hypothetical protein